MKTEHDSDPIACEDKTVPSIEEVGSVESLTQQGDGEPDWEEVDHTGIQTIIWGNGPAS